MGDRGGSPAAGATVNTGSGGFAVHGFLLMDTGVTSESFAAYLQCLGSRIAY